MPDLGEQLSPTGEGERGPGAVVLDLDGPEEGPLRRFGEPVRAALPSLPCVTIARSSPAREDRAHDLEAACDVVVHSEDALASLLRGIAANPIASLAFVQLLRAGPANSTYQGLTAESFVYSTLQAGAEFQAWLADRTATGRTRRGARSTEASAKDPACHMERVGDCLEIRLNRPDKHNAFSRSMRDGLTEALQCARADPSLVRIDWRGEGPSFCSGGDLDEFGSFPDPAMGHAIRTTRSPAWLLSELAPRVRTEVHGACLGAGVELPAFTGHVVAREDAVFGLPELSLGLIPGAGGTVSLPRRIGRQRTAWLGLSGERIDAQTALAWGLVDEVRLTHHVETELE